MHHQAGPDRIDFDSIRGNNPIQDVVSRHIELRRSGTEYVARCPFHTDKTPSFYVVPKKDAAFCMGCGWHGDVFDFLVSFHSLHDDPQPEPGVFWATAKRKAALMLDAGALPAERPAPALLPDHSDEWVPVMPVPSDAPTVGPNRWTVYNPKRASDWSFTAVACWPYHNTDGRLIGYVARIEYADRKITPTITYCRHRDTGEHRWCSRPFPTPRPLYGLDRLALASSSAKVLLVSGEKCADAGKRLLPGFVCVTWPGGDRGVNSVDLSPLIGRHVVAWPDLDRQRDDAGHLLPYADQSGPAAMAAILARLRRLNVDAGSRGATGVLRVLDLEADMHSGELPDKWDIADAEAAGWNGATVAAWAKARAKPYEATPDPASRVTGGGPATHSSGPGVDGNSTVTEREEEEVMRSDRRHHAEGQSAETGGAHPSTRAVLFEDVVAGIARMGDDSLPLAEGESEATDALPALYSEDNVALRFAELHADNLRYVAAWGRWMQWNGQHWQHDDTLAAYDLARKVCRSVVAYVRADANLTPPQQNAVANKYGQAQTVAAVERLARSDRRLHATTDQWDADLWSLNTPGGIVDLRTGQLRAPGRGDYATKITRATPQGDCPNWIKFLAKSTAGDADLQAFLARMAGYALTGSTRDQALFFVYGTGGNGKGTFLNTLTYILNDYASVAGIDTFTESKADRHTTELARLRGARLVSAQEVEEGKRWAEAKIKALTGGDPITARFMRMDDFTFMPQFKLVIAGNHKPGLRNVDEAIKRRMHLIPFTVQIPAAERDPHLAEKLKAEADGILAWAIRGCMEWQRIGLQPPGSVLAATDEYLEQQDTLGAWLDDCCEVGSAYRAKSSKLYNSFRRWAEAAGEYVLPQKRWVAAMESRGYVPKRRTSGVEFDNLRITYDDELDSYHREAAT